MKIIFVIKSLKSIGGSERVATLLANLLQRNLKGAELIILTGDKNHNDKIPFFLDRKIKVLALGGHFYFIYNLNKLIKCESPDYVVFHNMGKLSLIGALLAKKGMLFYSLEHTSYLGRSKLINFISRFLYHRFNKVIVLTDKDSLFYRKLNYNIVKISNFSPYHNVSINYDLDSKRIIAVGRLSKEKNYKSLVLAWAIIEDKMQDWILEIYGEGEEYGVLSNLISEKKLKNIFLKGVCHDVATLYNSSSFIVMSSLYEGLPMVLIEAQSFGLPIVSFDCPYGPSEIITNDKDGILVENQNIDKLAESILYLASNPDVRSNYSSNALESAKRFSKDIILEQWKALFEDS